MKWWCKYFLHCFSLKIMSWYLGSPHVLKYDLSVRMGNNQMLNIRWCRIQSWWRVWKRQQQWWQQHWQQHQYFPLPPCCCYSCVIFFGIGSTIRTTLDGKGRLSKKNTKLYNFFSKLALIHSFIKKILYFKIKCFRGSSQKCSMVY